MAFDPSVDTATGLALLAMLATFAVFSFKLSSEIGKINLKLDLIWQWFMDNHRDAPRSNGAAPRAAADARPHA